MTLVSSIALLLIVAAAIALVAAACFAPRKKSRPRHKPGHRSEALDPLSDPPTITHHGHA